ncbi:MAG: hypothetical protein LBE74_04330 [Treponema sp.]|nr:hypothetical protein [Treponema sp.]
MNRTSPPPYIYLYSGEYYSLNRQDGGRFLEYSTGRESSAKSRFTVSWRVVAGAKAKEPVIFYLKRDGDAVRA